MKNQDTKLIFGKTYDLLSNSEAAIVTSGTATLETALLGIPEVVCYKGSPISYRIAKALIKIRFISLVNLIMDREVVKELIQKVKDNGGLNYAREKMMKYREEAIEILNTFSFLNSTSNTSHLKSLLSFPSPR